MKYYFTVLRKYASVQGRARRAEYWYFFLFNFLVTFCLAIIEVRMHLAFLQVIYAMAMFLPSLAVGMRRMHDREKYGWYAMIPIYSNILALLPGTKGPNMFGPDPKSPTFPEGETA